MGCGHWLLSADAIDILRCTLFQHNIVAFFLLQSFIHGDFTWETSDRKVWTFDVRWVVAVATE